MKSTRKASAKKGFRECIGIFLFVFMLLLLPLWAEAANPIETHAAAQVCRNYGVPFLGIRILSNAELHGEEFNPSTGTACQQYVLAVIKSYAERKAKKA